MAFVRVASASELEPGWVIEAEVNGEPYALCNVEGEIHALDGRCPCTGGPLGCGALRDGLLVCPWHGWRFDCRTGTSAFDDDVQVRRFPVKVEDGEIWIDVP